MAKLQQINKDTELLIQENEKVTTCGNGLQWTETYRIIYGKETRQFMLLYFGVFKGNVNFVTQILSSENPMYTRCYRVDENYVIFENPTEVKLGYMTKLVISQKYWPETYKTVQQLYNNEFQHPLVDEFEGVGMFK